MRRENFWEESIAFYGNRNVISIKITLLINSRFKNSNEELMNLFFV